MTLNQTSTERKKLFFSLATTLILGQIIYWLLDLVEARILDPKKALDSLIFSIGYLILKLRILYLINVFGAALAGRKPYAISFGLIMTLLTTISFYWQYQSLVAHLSLWHVIGLVIQIPVIWAGVFYSISAADKRQDHVHNS